MKMTYLTQLPVLHATGQHLGKVEDAILDLDDGSVAYWRITLGARRRAVSLLIAARRIAVQDEQMTVHMNLDDLQSAMDMAERGAPHIDPASMPIMLPLAGSFGHSTLNAFGFGWGRQGVKMPEGAPDSWLWGQEVLNKPLFTARGELGRISDVEIDTATGDMKRVLVRGPNGETSFVAASALRHVPEEKTHFVAHVGGSRGLPA